MAYRNLEELIQAVGNPVDLLRNSQTGPYVYPVIPPEYTNWRDEQRAWQEGCIIYNQCYHMSDMYVSGPHALKLLTELGTNSFANFAVNKAKQYAPCNYEGYLIGDVILFHLEENLFNLVGRPSVLNWVQYHCETGNYDAAVARDERAVARKGPIERKVYRYQVLGPNAKAVMEKATGKPAPDLKFFNMCELRIAGKALRALRHGMAGQPGYEIFGPWGEGDAVKEALMQAGSELGIRLCGARAYSSNTLESGWIPSPMPAVYSGDSMKPYREWLPANGYEAIASLGGSFVSDKIEDYYLTPYDLSYGMMVKFDHDFIGREALEKHAQNPRRRKVTLELNGEDVNRAIGAMFQQGDRCKYMDFPSAVYSTLPYDAVLRDGKTVGLSTWIGYSSNERKMLTLAMLDVEHAELGTEVSLLWGEPDGGTRKPTVESHVQTEIRAIVCPVPYSQVARSSYAPPGWRNQ